MTTEWRQSVGQLRIGAASEGVYGHFMQRNAISSTPTDSKHGHNVHELSEGPTCHSGFVRLS
jgi:hypothetical protein